jgi:hypothetical protein
MFARLSSITVIAVPDQTSDRSATPSYRGPRITRFKLPQQLLCNSRVAVVQATDTRFRNYRAAAHARLSSTRRLFLLERNHLVEQLTAAASHPSLRYSVLPGACNRTSQWRNAHCANRGWHFESVFGVVIKHDESGDVGIWEGILELLSCPDTGWMPGEH